MTLRLSPNLSLLWADLPLRPMARNLLAAGADLIVHNRSRAAQEALVAAGATAILAAVEAQSAPGAAAARPEEETG
ncbi:MAG TPA: NAD(P)-binding domain-containing protein [Streptosporangiaceae bacterium]